MRTSSSYVRIGHTPTSTGIGHVPPMRCAERVERLEVEEQLRHREARARGDLAVEAVDLELEVVRRRVDRDAGEERRRRVDRAAVEVLAAVQPRHQLDEPDRVDVVAPSCVPG